MQSPQTCLRAPQESEKTPAKTAVPHRLPPIKKPLPALIAVCNERILKQAS